MQLPPRHNSNFVGFVWKAELNGWAAAGRRLKDITCAAIQQKKSRQQGLYSKVI